jgi:hypothetical protein
VTPRPAADTTLPLGRRLLSALTLLAATAAAAIAATGAQAAPTPRQPSLEPAACATPTRDPAANPVNYVELDGHSAAYADGAINADLVPWVRQQERRQAAAEAAAACRTSDSCLSGWQRVGGALELASVFAPLPTPTKATLALKVTAAGVKGTKAAKAAESGAGVATDLHHMVPREILRQLPQEVANNPLVRGRAGAPNRWPVPRGEHVDIHRGAGGGAYNQAWKDALRQVGRQPTVGDVLRIRDRLGQQFGLEKYRPGR